MSKKSIFSNFLDKELACFSIALFTVHTSLRQPSSIYWFLIQKNVFLCFSFDEKRKISRHRKEFAKFCHFCVIIGIDNSLVVDYLVYTNAFGVIWDALTQSGSCNQTASSFVYTSIDHSGSSSIP